MPSKRQIGSANENEKRIQSKTACRSTISGDSIVRAEFKYVVDFEGNILWSEEV